MKKVENLLYFTTITLFVISILFTITSSIILINFNQDNLENIISYLETFSSIINGNILSIAYAQGDSPSQIVELEEEEPVEVEEEEPVEVEEEEPVEVEEEEPVEVEEEE
ncbi:MAG TPA: hypothetical protein VFM28_11925, partial [Nitrososphaeraceae archaeon]|nr:hypothetical protein [Nitrososphaeraceae archaeon]